MHTFADVFAAFGGPAAFGRAIGIEDFHAQTMKTRDSIPPAYWPEVIAAAERRGQSWITAEKLAEIAAAKAGRAPPIAPDSDAPAEERAER